MFWDKVIVFKIFDVRFGLYEDYGNFTCGGYPGVLQARTSVESKPVKIHDDSKEDGKGVDDYDSQNMERDAKQFADWGVDYVKVAI